MTTATEALGVKTPLESVWCSIKLFWIQISWVQALVPPFSSYTTSGKFPSLSELCSSICRME